VREQGRPPPATRQVVRQGSGWRLGGLLRCILMPHLLTKVSTVLKCAWRQGKGEGDLLVEALHAQQADNPGSTCTPRMVWHSFVLGVYVKYGPIQRSRCRRPCV
jgi:hypothetical protein